MGGGAVALPAVELGLILELLAALAGHEGVGVGDAGEGGHVAPEFFKLSHGIDVFLAMASTFFDVFQCDIGRHFSSHGPHGFVDVIYVVEVVATEAEHAE